MIKIIEKHKSHRGNAIRKEISLWGFFLTLHVKNNSRNAKHATNRNCLRD